jgi:hypothetical protein
MYSINYYKSIALIKLKVNVKDNDYKLKPLRIITIPMLTN